MELKRGIKRKDEKRRLSEKDKERKMKWEGFKRGKRKGNGKIVRDERRSKRKGRK